MLPVIAPSILRVICICNSNVVILVAILIVICTGNVTCDPACNFTCSFLLIRPVILRATLVVIFLARPPLGAPEEPREWPFRPQIGVYFGAGPADFPAT